MSRVVARKRFVDVVISTSPSWLSGAVESWLTDSAGAGSVFGIGRNSYCDSIVSPVTCSL